MEYKQHIQNLIQTYIIFLFTLIISLNIATSLPVYASEGNGNQGNTNQSANTHANGIRTSQQ
jgi:hypothetical protein